MEEINELLYFISFLTSLILDFLDSGFGSGDVILMRIRVDTARSMIWKF